MSRVGHAGSLVWAALGFVGLATNACSDDAAMQQQAMGPMGALPCDGLRIDCLLEFEDDYTGTIAGSESGTLAIYIDLLGGITGTVTVGGSTREVSGMVNEFGSFELTSEDGSVYTGQFSDGDQFQGTWSSPTTSAMGTFQGVTTTPVASTGGAGGSGSGGTAGSGAGAGPAPDAASVRADATALCDKLVACGSPLDCTELAAAPDEDVIGPMECWAVTQASARCLLALPCDVEGCEAERMAVSECAENTAGGSSTNVPPDLTALGTVTDTCAACQSAGDACASSDSCVSYAACLDGCGDDSSCVTACEDQFPIGYLLWNEAFSCSLTQCF